MRYQDEMEKGHALTPNARGETYDISQGIRVERTSSARRGTNNPKVAMMKERIIGYRSCAIREFSHDDWSSANASRTKTQRIVKNERGRRQTYSNSSPNVMTVDRLLIRVSRHVQHTYCIHKKGAREHWQSWLSRRCWRLSQE